MFLLNISAHISGPPSMQRFLSEPVDSFITSGSLSDSLWINKEMIPLDWSSLRVEGSLAIKFEVAAHAQTRSCELGELNFSRTGMTWT